MTRTYVFITSTNAWGGIERWLVTLTNKLCEKQQDVHLLLIRDGSVPYPDQINKNIKITTIKKTPLDLFLSKKINNFLCNIDNPIIISFKYKDWFFISKIKKTRPSLTTYFSVRSHLNKGLNGNKRKKNKLSKALNSPNKIICISKGGAKHIASSYNISPDKIEVIYNPVMDPLPTSVDHPWLITPRPTIPTFISAGRLVATKDFSTLIRAFSIANKTLKSRLIILGEGPQRQKLENLVIEEGLQNHVSMPGFVNNPMDYFRRSSAFIFSSLHEGLGNVLVEALKSRIAIVSTDCPHGPREILENGQLGQLVTPGDTLGLAEAMIRSISEKTCSEIDLEKTLMRFDADAITDKFIEVTQNISQEAVLAVMPDS